MTEKRLLIVAHAPSPNTARLRDAIAAGTFAMWESDFHANRAQGDIDPL